MFKKPMSLHKVIDYHHALILTIGAIGITFADIENALKLLSLLLAISYTTWKWVTDSKARQPVKKKAQKIKAK